VSVFEKVALNFAPLYQCSYIYESIGEKEEFQKFYIENRKVRANLLSYSSFLLRIFFS